MALTKLDALIAELEPYTVSGSALRKALADAGVETETEAKEPEKVAEVVTVGSESYPVAVVKKALNAIGVKTAANAGLKAVSEKVSELSEEQAQELAKELTK